MTVSRHPMFNAAGSALAGLPIDGRLMRRLQATHRVIPFESLRERFIEFFGLRWRNALVLSGEEGARLASAFEDALRSAIFTVGDENASGVAIKSFGAEMRRLGLSRADAPQLIGTVMASLIDVAGKDWPLETVVEWSQAITLLIEAAIRSPSAPP